MSFGTAALIFASTGSPGAGITAAEVDETALAFDDSALLHPNVANAINRPNERFRMPTYTA